VAVALWSGALACGRVHTGRQRALSTAGRATDALSSNSSGRSDTLLFEVTYIGYEADARGPV
jgi:hypothetical protein